MRVLRRGKRWKGCVHRGGVIKNAQHRRSRSPKPLGRNERVSTAGEMAKCRNRPAREGGRGMSSTQQMTVIILGGEENGEPRNPYMSDLTKRHGSIRRCPTKGGKEGRETLKNCETTARKSWALRRGENSRRRPAAISNIREKSIIGEGKVRERGARKYGRCANQKGKVQRFEARHRRQNLQCKISPCDNLKTPGEGESEGRRIA